MGRGRERRGRPALALLWLALAGGLTAAARAEEPIGGGPPAAAGADADPAATGDAAPPYGSSDLDRHRGTSVDLDARAAGTSEPDFGAEAKDPGALPGHSKPLDAVARPPDGRDAEPRDDAPTAEQGDEDVPRELEDAPPAGPAPLRLRRRPDVAAPGERSLAERLCAAQRDVAFAEREHRDAVRAYKRARREEYPRGSRRALVVEHRALTARRLERSVAERDALLVEAESQRLDASAPCRRPL